MLKPLTTRSPTTARVLCQPGLVTVAEQIDTFQLLDVRTDRLDNLAPQMRQVILRVENSHTAHILVTENIAFLELDDRAVVQVKVLFAFADEHNK